MKRWLALLLLLPLGACGYNRIQTLDEQAGATQSQISVQLQRRSAVHLNGAPGVGDINLNIERAAGYFDRTGIGDGALIPKVASLGELDQGFGAVILQRTAVQHLHRASDGDGFEILEDRVGAEADFP